ncbi:hypothetical protein ACFL35_10000 [Candidatus Riflebacteria bacterium]
MELLPHFLGILGLSLLCACWVLFQVLAKKAGTKNHFEYNEGEHGLKTRDSCNAGCGPELCHKKCDPLEK